MVANTVNIEAHGICLFTANHGPALMVRKIKLILDSQIVSFHKHNHYVILRFLEHFLKLEETLHFLVT